MEICARHCYPCRWLCNFGHLRTLRELHAVEGAIGLVQGGVALGHFVGHFGYRAAQRGIRLYRGWRMARSTAQEARNSRQIPQVLSELDQSHTFRQVSGGHRREPSETEFEDAVNYAESIGRERYRPFGIEEPTISANNDLPTGMIDGLRSINLGSDLAPASDVSGLASIDIANAQVSVRGAVAHEMVGHWEAFLAGLNREQDFVNPTHGRLIEEAQASFRAALNAPNLTNGERITLTRDALSRMQRYYNRGGSKRDTIFIWTGNPFMVY